MIKGCNKRVIVVKHPETDAFEEAYFIVREGKYRKKSDTNNLLKEAHRIINAQKGEKKTISQKKSRFGKAANIAAFLLGMCFGFILMYILINL